VRAREPQRGLTSERRSRLRGRGTLARPKTTWRSESAWECTPMSTPGALPLLGVARQRACPTGAGEGECHTI